MRPPLGAFERIFTHAGILSIDGQLDIHHKEMTEIVLSQDPTNKRFNWDNFLWLGVEEVRLYCVFRFTQRLINDNLYSQQTRGHIFSPAVRIIFCSRKDVISTLASGAPLQYSSVLFEQYFEMINVELNQKYSETSETMEQEVK